MPCHKLLFPHSHIQSTFATMCMSAHEAHICQMCTAIYRAACRFPNEAWPLAVGGHTIGRINSHGRISKEAEVPSGQTQLKVHRWSSTYMGSVNWQELLGSTRAINHLRLLSTARETPIIRIISSAVTLVVLMFCKDRNWSGAPNLNNKVQGSRARRLNRMETNMLSRPAEVTERCPLVSRRKYSMTAMRCKHPSAWYE